MKCFNLKRVSAYILAICLISQMFPITANAASKQFKETAKAGVPLRYAVGSENAIVARIEDQGVAVEIFEHTQNVIGPKKRTTWYKISVEEGYTNNGLHGVFWVYGGNLCAHEHKMVAGRCTKPGCTVDYNDFETTKVDCTLKITRDDAPIRALPYNDGEVLQRKNTGECVSAVASLTNYKGSKWYQLASGSYIFSGNVKVATEIDKVVTNNSIINASGSGSSGSGSSGSGSSGSGGAGGSDGSSGSKPTFGDIIDDFIIYEPAPCTKHKWSVGVCTSCGTQWKLNITPVQATFRIKEDDISARNIPYKQGKVMRQFEAGALVSITGKAQNSAKNTWYQTDEGYWIYSDNLLDVSAKKMYLSSSGYTFTESGQTLQVRPRYEPEGAVILSEEWSSSNENVATVQDGLITAIGDVQDTKAIITCIATSAEGAVLKAEMQVVVPVSVNWDVWEYDNDVFNYDLALECSALMCLAYPRYDYTYHKGELIVFECGGESIEPKNLLRLLKDKGMNYQVSYNYYNKRRDNSPYVLASKYVTYNGKTTPLVYVIIEGSAGLPGWEGNMMVSGSSYKEVTDHQTFKKSAENIHEGIRAYIQQFDSLGEKPLIVVTGHSRGAAVANLLAHDLGRDTKVGDVYAYTFATPNATTKPVADNYIFNICNQLDFVAYIPLSSNYGSKWGFAKHGTTYSFDAQNLLKNNKKFKSIMQEQVAIPPIIATLTLLTIGIWVTPRLGWPRICRGNGQSLTHIINVIAIHYAPCLRMSICSTAWPPLHPTEANLLFCSIGIFLSAPHLILTIDVIIPRYPRSLSEMERSLHPLLVRLHLPIRTRPILTMPQCSPAGMMTAERHGCSLLKRHEVLPCSLTLMNTKLLWSFSPRKKTS